MPRELIELTAHVDMLHTIFEVYVTQNVYRLQDATIADKIRLINKGLKELYELVHNPNLARNPDNG